MAETTDKQGSNPPAKSFESAFGDLEEVVRKLEVGGLSLDEATKLFESGMKLATKCNEILSAAELKITRLQANFAEKMNLDLVPDDAAENGSQDEDA